MYEELTLLLEGRASPELTEVLLSLDATLAQAGFTMHRDELDFIVGKETDIDGAELLVTVTAIMRQAADKVLDLFEVEVGPEIPLGMLISLISALSTFGPSDNCEQIDAILQMQAPADEALCDILELTTEFTSTEYLPYIAGVGDNLLSLMTEKVTQYLSTTVTDDDVPAETRARIQRYRAKVSNDFAEDIANDGVQPGASMEGLYKQYTDRLLDLSVEAAVKDLVYLALLSNVSNEALADETAFFIEDLYPDIENNQKANHALRKELASLESLFTEGD